MIIWKYDKNGNLIGEIGKKNLKKDIPGFIIPSPYFDVNIDPDGFLWTANTGRHSLENYTSDGSFRTSWGNPSMELEGFAGCCNPSHFAILKNGSFVTSEKGIAFCTSGPKKAHRVVRLMLLLPSQFMILILIWQWTQNKEYILLIIRKKQLESFQKSKNITMNNEKQNRREFIISSTRKTLIGGLSLFGFYAGIDY